MQLLNSTFPLREESPLSVAVTAALPTIDDTQELPVKLIHIDEIRKVAVKPLPVPHHPLLSDTDRVLMSRWSAIIKSSLAKGIGAIFELGDNLVAAKKAVGHGLFLVILKELVRFCPRQAQKYMRIASKRVIRNSNYAAVIPHTVSVLYPLSGLDDLTLVQGFERAKQRIKHGEKFNVDRLDSWYSLIPDLGQPKAEVKGMAKNSIRKGVQSAEEVKTLSTPAIVDLAHSEAQPNKANSMAGEGHHEPGSESVAQVTANAETPTPSDPVRATDSPIAQDRPTEAPDAEDTATSQNGLAIQAPSSHEPSTDKEAIQDQEAQIAANDDGNVVRISPPPQASTLTAEENAIAQHLVKAWNSSMNHAWLKSPKAVRLAFIAWLSKAEVVAA